MSSQSAKRNFPEVYDTVLIEITDYVFHYEINTSDGWERSRLALLDALGCAIESLHTSPECAKLVGPVVPGTIVPIGAKLPGTNHQLDPQKAAFDLGSMIRYLDHNDALGGAEWGHPSDNIGALLSVADWLSRSNRASSARTGDSESTNEPFSPTQPPMTVKTILIALIKAYEIQGGLQQLNSFNTVGLDHTLLVKVASTAVVSWLIGLSETQTLAALSQTFQDGHALRTFRQAPNAGPRKGWAAGDACMRAVQLALLTRNGQPGAPTALTDPKWGFNARLFGGQEVRLRQPYGSFAIENVGFKLMPAEGHAISAVEAALKIIEVFEDKGVKAERDVDAVKIRTQKPAFIIINKTGALRNAADRDHCLQYIVAVILLKGGVIETADYKDDSPWAKDLRVDQLREKMTVVEDEGFTKGYLDPNNRSCPNAIYVRLNIGIEIEEVVVEHPVGSARSPETLLRLKEKITRNLQLAFDEQRIERIFEAVGNDDLPVDELVDLFTMAV